MSHFWKKMEKKWEENGRKMGKSQKKNGEKLEKKWGKARLKLDSSFEKMDKSQNLARFSNSKLEARFFSSQIIQLGQKLDRFLTLRRINQKYYCCRSIRSIYDFFRSLVCSTKLYICHIVYFLTRINIFFYSSVIFKKSKKRKVNGKLNGFLTVFFTTKTETEKNGWKNFISANPA